MFWMPLKAIHGWIVFKEVAHSSGGTGEELADGRGGLGHEELLVHILRW